jgi:hypothetical protein
MSLETPYGRKEEKEDWMLLREGEREGTKLPGPALPLSDLSHTLSLSPPERSVSAFLRGTPVSPITPPPPPPPSL